MFERRSQGGFRWGLWDGAGRSIFRGQQGLTGTFQASLIWLRNPPLKARSGTSSKRETIRSPLPEKSAWPGRQNFIEVNPAQNAAHAEQGTLTFRATQPQRSGLIGGATAGLFLVIGFLSFDLRSWPQQPRPLSDATIFAAQSTSGPS